MGNINMANPRQDPQQSLEEKAIVTQTINFGMIEKFWKYSEQDWENFYLWRGINIREFNLGLRYMTFSPLALAILKNDLSFVKYFFKKIGIGSESVHAILAETIHH